MSQSPDIERLAGRWTYRSFLNNSDLSAQFNDLEFGRGTITITKASMGMFLGTIGGPGWLLVLNGSIDDNNSYSVRFQGKGTVSNEEWIYDYIGFVIKPWPNGVNQVPAITGSVVRTIPHSNGSGGIAPAGVVCSCIAVWQGTL